MTQRFWISTKKLPQIQRDSVQISLSPLWPPFSGEPEPARGQQVVGGKLWSEDIFVETGDRRAVETTRANAGSASAQETGTGQNKQRRDGTNQHERLQNVWALKSFQREELGFFFTLNMFHVHSVSIPVQGYKKTFCFVFFFKGNTTVGSRINLFFKKIERCKQLVKTAKKYIVAQMPLYWTLI